MALPLDAVGSDRAAELRAYLSDLIAADDVTILPRGVVRLRGYLLLPSDEAFGKAQERLHYRGLGVRLRREEQRDVMYIVPEVPVRPSRLWVNWLLLGLTVPSVIFVAMPSLDVKGVLAALPFAATLLAILLAHELGHYFVGRHFGIPLTLPYFVPLPFSPFGTMGAVIRLKAAPPNRRSLLAMAVAGPLCGLAVALPLLVLGLSLSEIAPLPTQNAILEGNSLLYAAIKLAVFGRLLPGNGVDVNLHPVAFAAWAGLFVTGMNLIPAGQLDGGHVAYVLLGERKARQLTLGLAVVLAGLAVFVWPGWALLAALLFALGRYLAVPLDEITPLRRRHVLLAVGMLVVFVLTFTPIPMILL
ncbi:MAG: site-2 protease family protein [Anaerolineae bacterium]